MNTKSNSGEIITKRAHALALVLGGGAAFTIAMQGLLSFAIPTQAEMITTLPSVTQSAPVVNLSDNIPLEARAAYVFDLKTGTVLFARNENEKIPLASVTKIMTALVARENISEGAVITLTKDDLSAEGDSGLRLGERWRAEDLLSVMLLISSNDAAHTIARFVGSVNHSTQADTPVIDRTHFIQMMNEKALALKLSEMEFFNESGLDVSETQNGGYGSARNVAELFAELWKKYPSAVEITSHKDARIISQDDIAHILPNTNEIVGHIPGLIASKTGYTTLAGGNLAVIFDRGMGDPIVAVVLGSSFKGRFEDMKKIVSTVTRLEISPE